MACSTVVVFGLGQDIWMLNSLQVTIVMIVSAIIP